MLEDGKADMYNACEWGNYCRVEETGKASRQVGRRAIITYAAIVVGPKSSIYTPQQLANVPVGVPFYFGTHYVALHLLAGLPAARHGEAVQRAVAFLFPPQGAAGRRSRRPTTLTEPHISLAEKLGCRIVCSSFYHGTEVASDRVDAETYGAFNRAVREAVRRINADKSAYMHYFIDYHVKRGETEVAHAQGVGLARKPPGGDRSGADPGRGAATHRRVAQELGHAGQDRRARQLVDDEVQRYAHVAAE